eukprot:c27211_g1_i1.p1 GENE.c27211_g1_i1~~c27211_g1_i1.p1  ORF type:complete len:524 (+),score=88.99 c27211_g1_i1:51-1622(+)
MFARGLVLVFLALTGTFELVHSAQLDVNVAGDQSSKAPSQQFGAVIGIAERFCQKFLKPGSMQDTVMKALSEFKTSKSDLLETSTLVQLGYISDLLESGPLFGTLPDALTHSNYDTVTYALAKVVRLFLVTLLFKALFVAPNHKAVITRVLNESRERAANIHRICTHMREFFEDGEEGPDHNDCTRKIPREVCQAAHMERMDQDEWKMCATTPSELGLIEGELDHAIERTLSAVDTYAPVMMPLVFEYVGSASSVMGIAQSRCMDRDERLINKISFLFYFQIYGPTPRCPEDNGTQTGFSEYTDGMRSVAYKCFAGYDLEGLAVRDINHLDSDTDGLEGEMPKCVRKNPPAAADTTVPQVEKPPLPVGTLRTGASEAAPIVALLVIGLQIYLYVTNQIAARRTMREDLYSYEINQMYTHPDDFVPKEAPHKFDHKAHGQMGVPPTMALYSVGYPVHEGGSATRFHIKRETLSFETRDLLNRDLVLQSFLLMFNIYSVVVSLIILPAFLARDAERIESLTGFII